MILRLVATRLLALPVSLVVLTTLSFGLIELMPGNPAVTLTGDFASPEDIRATEAKLGLDKPLGERFTTYLLDTARGDLGESFFTGQSVGEELSRRVPATLELVSAGLALAVVLGLILGVVGAYYRGRSPDRATRFIVTVLQSVPDFVLAILLILTLFFWWRLAPAPVGQLGLGAPSVQQVTGFMVIDTLIAGKPDVFVAHLRQLMLPALALGIVYAAFFGKVARSVLGPAMSSPQVEFARACGLPERQVVRYALLSVRAPILTYGAVLFGSLIGGAAIIETIFSWGGAGQWALEAILKLDIPVIQGFILVAGIATILIYLVLDVATVLLDPRVRL